MINRTLGHRAPLLWLVLPLLAGLAAGGCGLTAKVPVECGAALLAAGAAVLASTRFIRLWAPALVGGLALAGHAGYGLAVKSPSGWGGSPAREARLSLHLDRVAPGSDATRRATGTATIASAAGRLAGLRGTRLYFSLWLRRGQPAPVGSSTMDAVGLLSRVPLHPQPDSFDGYLRGLGVTFFLSRGRLLGVRHGPTAYRLWCERLARRMNDLLADGLGRQPRIAAVYRAMMLGRRRGLGKDQSLLFLHGGAMHLFAINGLHIGVVAVSMNALLALARCPRRVAGALVLAVLWLDVDTTGASPSAVRAFLMLAAVEVAWMFRRPVNPLAAVTASALIVLLADPMEFLSASFQMSYSVVAAIFLLGLPLGARLMARFSPFRDLPEASWHWRHRLAASIARHLCPAAGVGAAAALISAVAGVEFFGLFAPVGLVANLLLAPIASLVIVSGFASLVAGLARASLATRLFNGASGLMLALIGAILRFVTRLPGAWVPCHYRATWIGPAALAALIAACMAGYAAGWRAGRGGFWPPFAIVALTFALGVKFG